MRFLRSAVGIMAVFSSAPLLAAQQVNGASGGAPEIVTSGTGTVSLKADGAMVTIAVVTRGSSASDAVRANATAMQNVLTALSRLGQPDSSLVTAGFAVSQDRDPSRQQLTEATYVARNAVQVRVSALNTLGGLVDSALAAGATEVANVTFTSTAERGARQQAVARAVAAARQDAEAAAVAAGGRLGRVIEVSFAPDAPYAYGIQLRAAGMSVAPYTPLLPRDVTVAAVVRMRHQFRQDP